MKYKSQMKGFTLIEMLLVLVVASMLIYMGLTYVQQKTLATRQDRTVLQMTQIMNASLGYFVSKGSWPASVAALQAAGFLPNSANATVSPWPGAANKYVLKAPANNGPLMYVWIPVTAAAGSSTGSATASANVIAGQLPMAYTTSKNGNPPPPPGGGGTACGQNTTSCYVVASINYPGQNLNNATAINFAGVYSNGGCVPAPVCPTDASGNAMTAEVFVVPISVSGVNDPGVPNNVYPISSFTAFAKGGAGGTPSATPFNCSNNAAAGCGAMQTVASTKYWRACLQVVTTKGEVSQTNSAQWGQYVKLGAFTRCAISGEAAGSKLTVFTP